MNITPTNANPQITSDNNSALPARTTELEAHAEEFDRMMNSDAPVEGEQLPAGPHEGASRASALNEEPRD